MDSRAGLILAAILLAAVFLGLAGVVAGSASRGSFSAAGSSYRAAPDGVRGLYLLAEGSGVPTSRRHVDLEVIEEQGVLFLVGMSAGRACEAERPHARDPIATSADADADASPPEPAVRRAGLFVDDEPVPVLSPLECQALRTWVQQGGRLVHVTDRPDALLATLGLHVKPANLYDTDDEAPDGAIRLVPGQPSVLVAGVDAVQSPTAGTVVIADGGDEVILLETGDGDAVAVARAHGAGEVVVIAAPALATNRWIGEADNAVFWANLLRELSDGEPLQFVEHRRGFGDERSIIGYLLGRGLAPALGQVALVFLLATAAARRVGRPLPVAAERLRVGGDHLSAMSRLYQVGGHGLHAGECIADRAREQAGHRVTDRRVAAALEALEGARMRLRKRSVEGEASEHDVAEVARRAAAVYDAISRKKGGV
jgi:hypothetical protein